MMKVKRGQIEELLRLVMNAYILEHGGAENQPYITLCWASGRVEDLIRHFRELIERKHGKGAA